MAIMKPLIIPQIPYPTFQDRDANLLPCELETNFSLLGPPWILQFNARSGAQAPCSDKLPPGRGSQDEAKILNGIKIVVHGRSRQNSAVRSKDGGTKGT